MRSFPDGRGRMVVFCSECERGGNGDRSCSAGGKIKKHISMLSCMSGRILPQFQEASA